MSASVYGAEAGHKTVHVHAIGRSLHSPAGARLEALARLALESHPHFRGRAEFVYCHCDGQTLWLDGCVPTYYLKQLAQEALREFRDMVRIENRISVASPSGEMDQTIQVDSYSTKPR